MPFGSGSAHEGYEIAYYYLVCLHLYT